MRLFLFLFVGLFILSCNLPKNALPMEVGVSQNLALERAERLRNIRYNLSFDIPEGVDEVIPGKLTLNFELLDAKRDLQLDFKEKNDHLTSLVINGREITAQIEKEHILLPGKYLKKGENEVDIKFIAGELSLNRNEDYLYTLLVPDRARTTFPCFDQPDLKARFTLKLEIPATWTASGNGSLETMENKGERRLYAFRESAPISTYLFAFAAGRFKIRRAERDGRPMSMLYRESDTAKVAASMETIFDLHAHALNWLEEYTGIPYPFEKFDFVLIPTFQYGGMEHVGNIFYRESSLMLDETATTNQKLSRASLIAHETAHMWFGDLVTMQWFNDVWLKEVFANFMAAKIVNPSFPEINHELRFMLSHQPSAYGEDRSEGAHPIQQPLENLKDAGTLYGRIIYQKAPVVMRQLETLMGETAFRDGLRAYLQKFSFGNATWDDLIGILDEISEKDLKLWSQVWVKEAGMPQLSANWQSQDGKISNFSIQQDKTSAKGAYWPQETTISLFYPDSVYQLKAYVEGQRTELPVLAGLAEPLGVLSNSSSISYGYFRLDEQSKSFLLENAFELEDPVLRGAASLALYESFLQGDSELRVHYFDSLLDALQKEDEILNRQRLLNQLTTVFWNFQSEAERTEKAPLLENMLWNNLQKSFNASGKRAYFNAFKSVALSADAVDKLQKIYEGTLAISGLPLSESDRNGLACELALRLPAEADRILEAEINATQNTDRKKRLIFIQPSLSPDQAVRDQFFEGLKEAENRRIEPWALGALGYLHHPLRAKESEKYILPSLELLEEIQATGDIFFPRRWVGATLNRRRSPEAAAIIRNFLAARPDYPYRLRNKILMAADLLFRAAGSRESRESRES